MMNFNRRYSFLLLLLALGLVIFSFWSYLFFVSASSFDLRDLNLIGFVFLVLALLSGAITYATVLAKVLYKREEYKADLVFRKAFYKISKLFFASVVLAVGMTSFVVHFLSRIVITVKNTTDINIERVVIQYPREGMEEMGELKQNEQKTHSIFTSGEGEVNVRVTFSDGSSKEHTIVGYASALDRTRNVHLDVTK